MRANSLRRLSEESAIVNHTSQTPAANRQAWASGIASVAGFGLCVALLALLLSFIAKPWVELSLWKVFRRCVSIASALSLWIFIRKLERRSFRSYGFAAPRAGKRQFVFGVLLGLGALGLLCSVWSALGACRVHLTPDLPKLWGTVIGFLPIALLVGVLEELVFRGFILQKLMPCSRVFAVIVSSALYAVVHLKAATLDLAAWLELGGLFLLGGVLAFSYLLTHQLYLAVGLHAVLAYGARVNKLLIEFTNPSIAWLAGTSKLVNGVGSWVILLGVSGVVAWWVRSSDEGGVHHGNA